MTTHVLLGAALAAGVAVAAAAAGISPQDPPFPVSGCSAEAVTFAHVRLPQAVVANGTPLAAGTYEVRITVERPRPAVGQSTTGECWVEFVSEGVVAGRDLVSVVAARDIASVAKGPAPKPSESRVDVLKGGDYVRVWMNSGETHYIVNLPTGK